MSPDWADKLMSRRSLIFTAVNVTIIGMLAYLFHTKQMTFANLPIVAAICFVSMNGLVFLMLRHKKQ
jgi:hypothetical protein